MLLQPGQARHKLFHVLPLTKQDLVPSFDDDAKPHSDLPCCCRFSCVRHEANCLAYRVVVCSCDQLPPAAAKGLLQLQML